MRRPLNLAAVSTITESTTESGGSSSRTGGGGGTIITKEGVVRLGPQHYGLKWKVNKISINSTSTDATTCRVYRGQVSPGTLIQQFADGTKGFIDDMNLDVQSGDQLTFLWTNGTTGATVVASVEGEVYHA